MRIYWANALFTEADRDFNAKCAAHLRSNTFDVFMPQEADVNSELAPSAEHVFRVDTSALLNCDVVVACLDQETIDSGVASEIGIAYSYCIPVIGFYTDLRQGRVGRGRMYKNLYVLGAIEMCGTVVSNIDGLVAALNDITKKGSRAIEGNSGAARSYDVFVRELERWYKPSWSSEIVIDEWMDRIKPRRVLEIGCGTGRLGRSLCERYSGIEYFGYDISAEAIEIAQQNASPRSHFTSDKAIIGKGRFDLALASFTLHDHDARETTLRAMRDSLSNPGFVGVLDLSTSDLPRVTEGLRRALACPAVAPDPRIEPTWMSVTARNLDLKLVDCSFALFEIEFPAAVNLERYLQVFGIHAGYDLPLNLGCRDFEATREIISASLRDWRYPFADERAFIKCLLTNG